MGDVATAVLPVVEAFGSIVAFLAESKALTGALIGITVALAVASKTMAAIQMVAAVAKIFGESAKAGPIVGTIAALAGVAALVGAVAMVRNTVKDGFAPASKGPFTITNETTKLSTRARGRQMAMKLESSGTEDDWQLGDIRINTRQDGLR